MKCDAFFFCRYLPARESNVLALIDGFHPTRRRIQEYSNCLKRMFFKADEVWE
jgi:hypothetical protein